MGCSLRKITCLTFLWSGYFTDLKSCEKSQAIILYFELQYFSYFFSGYRSIEPEGRNTNVLNYLPLGRLTFPNTPVEVFPGNWAQKGRLATVCFNETMRKIWR